MDKLKPCPFCGNVASLFKYADCGEYREPQQPEVYINAKCEVCGASVDNQFTSRTDAIEAWNRRHNDNA